MVGLGLVGAAALRHLATAGLSVVGIGPAEPVVLEGHPGAFASHYDSGRITRRLDPRGEWGELAARSIAAYAELAAASGIAFHTASGTVLASADPTYLAAVTDVGDRVGVPFATHAAGDPALDPRLRFAPGATVLVEPAPAGFIDPRRMLQAQIAVAEAHGARVERTEVVAIDRANDPNDGWAVRLADGGLIEGRRVLVAAGAHTDEIAGIAAPAFAVRAEAVVLAQLDAEEAERLAGLPSVLAHLDGGAYRDLYQVPPTTYPDGTRCLKLGATLRVVPRLDDGPSRRAWMGGTAHREHLGPLRALVEALVPGIRAVGWTTRPCLITDTARGLPVIDHLGPGLVVAAGGNGYAAKSSDAIGALAAGLLRNGRWTDPALPASAFRG